MVYNIVITAKLKISVWTSNISLLSSCAYSRIIEMYSYIILANGTKNKPDNCQEHKWDSEVNIRSFFVCKHSIYSAIGRHIEIFRVASSIVICVSFRCLLQLQLSYICYNRRILHFQAWGSQLVDCLTFSSLLYGWWILQAVLIARVSQCSHLILPFLPTTTFSISFVIFEIYIGLSNGYFIVRWLADSMYKISPYIVFVLHPIWLLQ